SFTIHRSQTTKIKVLSSFNNLEEEICDLTNDGQQAEQEVWDKFQAAIQHIDQCRSEFDANVKMVVDWILQTKGHLTAVTTTPDMYGDDDLHFFLDMDLGILGADRTRYMEYAADIRKEYCHVPDGVFHRRRIELMNTNQSSSDGEYKCRYPMKVWSL
ncbi:hypothetical protein DPMN_083162, partial [Dreissena polymorpha]